MSIQSPRCLVKWYDLFYTVSVSDRRDQRPIKGTTAPFLLVLILFLPMLLLNADVYGNSHMSSRDDNLDVLNHLCVRRHTWKARNQRWYSMYFTHMSCIICVTLIRHVDICDTHVSCILCDTHTSCLHLCHTYGSNIVTHSCRVYLCAIHTRHVYMCGAHTSRILCDTHMSHLYVWHTHVTFTCVTHTFAI